MILNSSHEKKRTCPLEWWMWWISSCWGPKAVICQNSVPNPQWCAISQRLPAKDSTDSLSPLVRAGTLMDGVSFQFNVFIKLPHHGIKVKLRVWLRLLWQTERQKNRRSAQHVSPLHKAENLAPHHFLGPVYRRGLGPQEERTLIKIDFFSSSDLDNKIEILRLKLKFQGYSWPK